MSPLQVQRDDRAAAPPNVAVHGLPVPGVGNRRHGAARHAYPLTLWFWAAYLMTTATPGISAVQLQLSWASSATRRCG